MAKKSWGSSESTGNGYLHGYSANAQPRFNDDEYMYGFNKGQADYAANAGGDKQAKQQPADEGMKATFTLGPDVDASTVKGDGVEIKPGASPKRATRKKAALSVSAREEVKEAVQEGEEAKVAQAQAAANPGPATAAKAQEETAEYTTEKKEADAAVTAETGTPPTGTPPDYSAYMDRVKAAQAQAAQAQAAQAQAAQAAQAAAGASSAAKPAGAKPTMTAEKPKPDAAAVREWLKSVRGTKGALATDFSKRSPELYQTKLDLDFDNRERIKNADKVRYDAAQQAAEAKGKKKDTTGKYQLLSRIAQGLGGIAGGLGNAVWNAGSVNRPHEDISGLIGAIPNTAGGILGDIAGRKSLENINAGMGDEVASFMQRFGLEGAPDTWKIQFIMSFLREKQEMRRADAYGRR